MREIFSLRALFALGGLSVFLVVQLNGCATLNYYTQAAGGQLEVLAKRRSVVDVLRDRSTKPEVRSQLELALRVREFASRELHLPENNSYRSYTDLERQYVVWNVFATPEFSLKPVTWCFPFVGCLAYRGYFSKQGADDYAEGLRDGYDVYVGGVAAYSTLGSFNDPLLNTMIGWAQPDLAGLIFHELAHQELYIPNDSAFNESFAVTVERAGVSRWMIANGQAHNFNEYVAGKQRHQEFVQLVMQTRERLIELFASGRPDEEMRRAKQEIFAQMREQYAALKAEWGGYAAFDRWMLSELNNAKIASLATYHQYVPAFQALLEQHDGDFPAFYRAVREIGKLPAPQRHAELERLMEAQDVAAVAGDAAAN